MLHCCVFKHILCAINAEQMFPKLQSEDQDLSAKSRDTVTLKERRGGKEGAAADPLSFEQGCVSSEHPQGPPAPAEHQGWTELNPVWGSGLDRKVSQMWVYSRKIFECRI